MNYKWSAALLSLITFFVLMIKVKIVDNIERLESIPPSTEKHFTEPSNKNKYKYILYWHKMFSTYDFYLGLGNEPFAPCPYSNCFASHDKHYLPSIDQWDALLFHGVEYQKDQHGEPANRSAHQNYIMYDLEPPIYSRNALESLGGFFNMTMTYRHESEIYNPYGNVFPSKTNYSLPSYEEIARKPKNKLAWFVSRCSSQSKRELLVRQLEKSFSVDIYGKCGTFVCPRSIEQECYKILEQTYKFYLSFENSVCSEYVTEKLFRMLRLNVVPIVYGGANYSQMAPPHSVINVQDFKSVADLVDYIKFLDNNPEEYLKYFEWKKHYRIESNLQMGKCNLCRVLNEERSSRTYEDVNKWWRNQDGKPACSDSFIKQFLRNA